MSDFAGWGQMAQAAVDFTKFMIGTGNQGASSQSSNSGSSGWQHALTSTHASSSIVDDIQKFIDTTVFTDTTTGSTGTTKTSGTSKTVGSADADVIATMKGLVNTAIYNSTDEEKTRGLITGILQNAGDAMKGIFGKQTQAGIYNSSATASMNNDIMSRAAADAAGAVLGYRVSQQNIAATVLDSLAKATATSETNTSTQTDTMNTSRTSGTQRTVGKESTFQQTNAVQDNRVAYDNDQDLRSFSIGGGNTKGRSGGLVSVICTWMYANGQMSTRRYAAVTADFVKKPFYQQKAYRAVAAPLYSYLERTEGKGVISALIIELFRARTEYVCALAKVKGCKLTAWGWIARALVTSICFLPALWYLAFERKTLVMEYN